MNINEALAWLDSRRRVAAANVRGLLSEPIETNKRLFGNVLQDFARQSRGLLDASANMNSVIPELREEAENKMLGGLLGMGSGGGGLAGVMTYHGTPHKLSAWDLSKVGSGQGAQAFGHGMYFAENPKVAKAYRDMLGRPEVVEPGGKTVSRKTGSVEDQAASWLEDPAVIGGSGNPFFAAMHKVMLGPSFPNRQEVYDKLAQWSADGTKVVKRGAMYKQDLPDEELPNMLQWDKPLNQQSEQVQKALNAIDNPMFNAWRKNGAWPHIAGQTLYRELARREYGRNALQASDLLRQSGIPGLSYLDAGSRDAGQGTLNHVIWDQDLLNRMRPQVVE